eukprot:396188-Hanusia_phi.AAC.1
MDASEEEGDLRQVVDEGGHNEFTLLDERVGAQLLRHRRYQHQRPPHPPPDQISHDRLYCETAG